jgi:hypothetical protein
MTLLTIVQNAAAELGFPTPPIVVGSTEPTARQFYALANRMGMMLRRAKDWTALQTVWIVNVVPPVITTGDITLGSTTIANIGTLSGGGNTVEGGTWTVFADGIQQATRVVTAAGATATMDQQATATRTGTALTFARDTYAVPADFGSFIDDTMWDRTNHWRLLGPISPQEDEWIRSGIVATGPRRRFRQVGRGLDTFRIWPPPSGTDAPATLEFEYVSDYWAASAAGVLQPQFLADSDTTMFDEDIFAMGVKWLFFQAKGFAYDALRADWQRQLDVAMAQDGGSRTLSMDRRRASLLIGPANVQDGYFPG